MFVLWPRDIHPRIIKGTLWLTKRRQPGSNQLGVVLHVPEDVGQSGHQFPLAGEVPIMGSILASVLPQPLAGIEFGRVGRELVDFQPVSVGLEPAPDLGVLMIRGVVLSENSPAAAIVQ